MKQLFLKIESNENIAENMPKSGNFAAQTHRAVPNQRLTV